MNNTKTVEEMTAQAQSLAEQSKSTAEIAEAMGISENYVRNLQYPFNKNKINWRQNCLTSGPHDGRPEAVWNMPLLYACTTIFHRPLLKDLVAARIYNDAMQIVANNDKFDETWADRVKKHAQENYTRVVEAKISELNIYYQSISFGQDMADAVDLVSEDKLNAFFEPLHSHDSINMLCRILGVPASMAAAK